MRRPKFSVIVPTYNYGPYLGKAVESVLGQTCPDFELVIVDDGSTDQTREVVAGYADPRVKYIYQENRGLPAARNTGIRAAQGELLAFLDADDQFHPQKLELHLALLESYPQAGMSYNHRILVDSHGNPLFLQRSPARVGLNDLLIDYPFTPSDMVIRREWAYKVGLFDESFMLNSEDLNFNLRLALAGCLFTGVDRALTYRQIHAGRIFKDIPGKMETYLRALDTAFLHPGCPSEALALRDRAYANHYCFWGIQALIQEEAQLGQSLLQEALRLHPAFLDHQGLGLVELMLWNSLRDGGEHEPRLQSIAGQLPRELQHLRPAFPAAIARGYLERGIRDAIWEREEPARKHFARAKELGARLDLHTQRTLSEHLSSVELEFGADQAQRAFRRLLPMLKEVGSAAEVRAWNSAYLLSRAFRHYQRRNYRRVPGSVLQAVLNNPSHLADKGVLSIFARSVWGVIDGGFAS